MKPPAPKSLATVHALAELLEHTGQMRRAPCACLECSRPTWSGHCEEARSLAMKAHLLRDVEAPR